MTHFLEYIITKTNRERKLSYWKLFSGGVHKKKKKKIVMVILLSINI